MPYQDHVVGGISNSMETCHNGVALKRDHLHIYIYIYLSFNWRTYEDLVYIHLRDLLKSEWRFSFNIYNMHGKSQPSISDFHTYLYIC